MKMPLGQSPGVTLCAKCGGCRPSGLCKKQTDRFYLLGGLVIQVKYRCSSSASLIATIIPTLMWDWPGEVLVQVFHKLPDQA